MIATTIVIIGTIFLATIFFLPIISISIEEIIQIVKNIPDFDYKLFFESYAKNNFYKTTENVINLNHQNDTHPPLYLRVNVTVQQFDEFYKTFNIKRKDGMFLKKEDRIEF